MAFTVREHTITTGFGEWTWSTTGKTGKRTWYLDSTVDVVSADADAAYAASPFAVGDPLYAGDTTRYCTKVTIKAIAGDNRGLYGEAEFNPNQFEQNPLLRPDKISLEVASETQDWFLDTENKPVVNSAKDVFDKVPPRTTGGAKLIIEGNRSTLPAAAMVDLSSPHSINSGPITVRGITIPAKSGKLSACSGSESTENGVTFYVVRWELSLAESWELKLDDRGYNEIDTSVTPHKLIPIIRAKAQVQSPWPLSGGAALAAGDAVPDQLTFKPYTETTFDFGWTSAA